VETAKKGGCSEDHLGIKNRIIAIFRMCYGENDTVKFFETLADNVFKHNYSMMQIKKKLDGDALRTTLVLKIGLKKFLSINFYQNMSHCRIDI
jgi:hypothetical protein